MRLERFDTRIRPIQLQAARAPHGIVHIDFAQRAKEPPTAIAERNRPFRRMFVAAGFALAERECPAIDNRAFAKQGGEDLDRQIFVAAGAHAFHPVRVQEPVRQRAAAVWAQNQHNCVMLGGSRVYYRRNREVRAFRNRRQP